MTDGDQVHRTAAPIACGQAGYLTLVTVDRTDPSPVADPDQEPVQALLGDVDAGNRLLPSEAVRLRHEVGGASQRHRLVQLRVDRVVAFDTAGIGLLLGLHRLARSNGAALVLLRPTQPLMAALRRRGLHRVLVVDESSDTPSGVYPVAR